jgi:ribosomal protein S18 acetylase RimI-like enzyme
MVARAARKSKASFRGVRLFDPTRDLGAVARLLEEAFRPDHNFPFSNVPMLRGFGIFLWTLGYAPIFPETTTGFVWVEDGVIVGNVTLNPDEGRLDRFTISNVAVKPNHRRQGIARALVQAALDHLRTLQVKTVLLNVRPDNSGAIKLYEDLGFEQIETRGEWRLTARHFLAETRRGAIRPLRESDHRAAAELVRAANANVRRFHPVRSEFALAWDDRIVETLSDFFIGQATRRWALELDGRLAALLLVRGQRIASPHCLAVETHPDFRGRVESDLLAFALRELERFPPRETRAFATSAHPEWLTTLQGNGFETHNALTLMALAL